MTFESRFSGTIRKGDLIAIAYENYMLLGIYVGRGKTKTVQYYSVGYLTALSDADKKLDRYSKSYINAQHQTRIIKVNPSDLNDKTLNAYKKAMIYLEQQNFKIER
jgi:23S rRNA maturation mini-RNase III